MEIRFNHMPLSISRFLFFIPFRKKVQQRSRYHAHSIQNTHENTTPKPKYNDKWQIIHVNSKSTAFLLLLPAALNLIRLVFDGVAFPWANRAPNTTIEAPSAKR